MSQEFIDAQVGIFAAAAKGLTDKIRSLVEKDPALVNAHSADGFTPLGLAVFFGHAETVQALLAASADVNLASNESMSMPPLGSAMAVQRNDIARILIEHGADVNGKAANNLTALHTAAARGNIEAAKLLLDHGADINAASTDGKTPLAYAEERNQPDMVEFLKSCQS